MRKIIFLLVPLFFLGCQGKRIDGNYESRPTIILEESPVESPESDAVPIPDKYQMILDSLDKILPGYFTTLIERPFIVIGDENPDFVRQRAENTVRWAVFQLKKNYFQIDPKTVIIIWLFKDDSSYYFHANKLFNEQPSSKFGYYSPLNKSLIMNIGTGGGTLVHEIVHPYIDANFPDCPPWFNEGLASLYEQCGEKNGSIWGFTNWRLTGLQDAVRGGNLPLFKDLMAMNALEFYGENSAYNYGQARYLCYYLQENHKLTEFYHSFVKNYAWDPSGYLTLQSILGESDMEDFQRRWQEFVIQLHFP